MNWTNLNVYMETTDGTEVINVVGEKVINFIKVSVSTVAIIVALLALLWMLINWFRATKATNPQEAEQIKKQIKYSGITVIACIASGVLINIIIPLITQFSVVS
ncbi:Mbov_0395 family pilin-like conjugal transfer protein [Mycoplasma anserisalpingitidis]|uniref:Mbov_0395 family pilin-like conjugal transfer protein n=1 Tax=Mycoplasma anserisalpingitidis TaxID=519450 RepID=UPI0011B1023A|nr:hypothetical protein [Mycoplasma anserisalpingitidis]QDY87722.1 hypothetical protein FOY45_02170 [Mycoplasma anserisalpingitidis]